MFNLNNSLFIEVRESCPSCHTVPMLQKHEISMNILLLLKLSPQNVQKKLSKDYGKGILAETGTEITRGNNWC